MQLLEKVLFNPNICSVEFAFSGELLAADISDWQEFYNSSMQDTDFSKAYTSLGSVAFNEESQESGAGTSYKQIVSVRFPLTDGQRSERLVQIRKVKFIKLVLTNGRNLVIGRNDRKQNTRPKVKIKTNAKFADVEFETVSMFPVGFVVGQNIFGLPSFIPLTLY